MSEIELLIAEALTQDIDSHIAGRYEEIGSRSDDLVAKVVAGADWTPRLGLVLNFWDEWIDARNHAWRYYEGIDRDDWPLLARELVSALESSSEIDDDTFARFAPKPRGSWRRRASELAQRLRGSGSGRSSDA